MQVFDQEIYDIVEKGLEGNGLSAEVIAACSAVVRIPIRAMESLNAAVAASVLMWELGGRRDG